jgi:rare lipoprotein A
MRNLLTAMTLSVFVSGCASTEATSRTYYANATWYACCKLTANGEKFNPNGMTVAHRRYPFGTKLRVTNPDNGRSIVVRVNDRGPFTKGVDLDISRGGAQQLGIIKKGRAKVRVEHLPSR